MRRKMLEEQLARVKVDLQQQGEELIESIKISEFAEFAKSYNDKLR